MVLRIAARQSDLARLQAYQVGQALSQQGCQINYHFRQSLGDINQDDPLWKMPEKGVFTEDFRQGLIDGQWDLVVHSWKDLPTDMGEGTQLAATLPRADVRDLLLFKKEHFEKVKSEKKVSLFSSSPRRIYNLSQFLKSSMPFELDAIQFESVRGNILTRVRKLIESSEVSGLVVAKAAMDRLLSVEGEEFEEGKAQLKKYFDQCYWQVLPVSANPAAAAQGALAVEISSQRKDLLDFLKKINCVTTWNEVEKEREILKSYGGGCHQKIGVTCLTRDYGKLLWVQGETESGEILDRLEQSPLELNLKKPLKEKPVSWKRRTLTSKKPEGHGAHFVAKSVALNPEVNISPEEIVWCSGLETWEKLARLGIWVHGCCESLGESEKPRIENLVGSSLKWTKWTHDRGFPSSDKTIVPSYQLQDPQVMSQMGDYQEFFWSSGTQFEAAVAHDPKILQARHFCGPGNTFHVICEILKNHKIDNKPIILASPKIWKQLCEEN